MNKPNRQLLLIFVKSPVAGKVKTRLAASIGNHQAVKVYKKLLNYTKEAALGAGPGIHKQVWYTGKQPAGSIWSSKYFQLQKQPAGDLGQKMETAFKAGFDNGFDKIVIIGSDCDQLNARHIRQAFDLLNDHEVVLGPSLDGGYYLLGMIRWLPMLFKNKSWSTSNLYEETLASLRKYKLPYSELEPLNDIDTMEDLRNSSLDL